MQKIIVKNFGAVKEAEVEIKKILVIIGEQASGKSTIAKLIYFFKSLRDDLFNQIYKDVERKTFDESIDFKKQIRLIFYDFFGSTYHLPDFEITYYYSNSKHIKLTLDSEKRLNAQLSPHFFPQDFRNSVNQIKELLQEGLQIKNIHEQLAHEQNKIKYAQKLSLLLNKQFESNQVDALFVIAGRNATVGYSEFFEKYLFASVQSTLEENSKSQENGRFNNRSKQTIDETLMLKFMEKVVRLKETFKKFGNFDGLIDFYTESKASKDKLHNVKDKIEYVLKGNYVIDNFGEKIVFNAAIPEYVYLSNASSGQQEAVRILQDVFMNILDNLKVLRILEEPEAHLFPVAQKHMIELLALMINQNDDSQLIITTHSPYVLSVFNNLLFASRVIEKNSAVEHEVSQIVPREVRLTLNHFSAYSLGNSRDNHQPYCSSIINQDTKLIEQNYLDEVSEMLGGDFDALYKIHALTFARK